MYIYAHKTYIYRERVHWLISDSHDCFQWEEKAFSINGLCLLCTCTNRPYLRRQMIHQIRYLKARVSSKPGAWHTASFHWVFEKQLNNDTFVPTLWKRESSVIFQNLLKTILGEVYIPYNVCSRVAFSTWTMLWNYHLRLVPRCFHHLQRIPCTHFSFPLALVTTTLLFVSTDWFILDISHKWSNRRCDLLCLASFSKA